MFLLGKFPLLASSAHLVPYEEMENAMTTEVAKLQESNASLQDILENRAATYRMFSRLFLSPLNEAEVDAFAAMELESVAQELENTGLLAEGFNDMGRGLHRRHTGTVKLLRTDYSMCFDGLASYEEVVAVPYASLFIGKRVGDKAILFQEPRKKDKAAYRAEHIQVDADLHLPDDHLSFELSFMADLSDKMQAALAAGNKAEALRLAEVSDDFRVNHILSWYDKLYELALKIVDTRFYRGVLKATFGYLELDGETLADIKTELS